MMDKRIVISSKQPQQGAALITGLIFIVMLTIIGVTATRMASLEERMAGNMRDRSLAMQAAELALRDAERDIIAGVRISGLTNFLADCGASTSATGDDGLCYNGTGGYAAPIWTVADMTAAPSVGLGDVSGADPLAFVAEQPRYLIEGFSKTPPGGGEEFLYRITVRAVGARETTVVWLQEVFKI
jgi:type IV pilus assembly protein PilX